MIASRWMDRPAKPGWYWYAATPEGTRHPLPVEVRAVKYGSGPWKLQARRGARWTSISDGHWSGPIVPPEPMPDGPPLRIAKEAA